MKRVVIALFLLLPAAYAIDIELSINTLLTGDMHYFYYNDSAATKEFYIEFLNTGSIPYLARMRVDAFLGGERVFTGWSAKKTVMPGNLADFRVYWFPEKAGNYGIRVRIYYAGEMIEMWKNVTVGNSTWVDVFEISNQGVFDRYVKIGVVSRENAASAVVIPLDYIESGVFEQRQLDSIEKDREKSIFIGYEPAVQGRSVTVAVASKDGKYFSKKVIQMERSTGISAVVTNLFLALASF